MVTNFLQSSIPSEGNLPLSSTSIVKSKIEERAVVQCRGTEVVSTSGINYGKMPGENGKGALEFAEFRYFD